MDKKVIILVGPSYSGKDYLEDILLRELREDIKINITHNKKEENKTNKKLVLLNPYIVPTFTTREKRKDDKENGHTFICKKEFDEKEREGDFIVSSKFGNDFYATGFSQLKEDRINIIKLNPKAAISFVLNEGVKLENILIINIVPDMKVRLKNALESELKKGNKITESTFDLIEKRLTRNLEEYELFDYNHFCKNICIYGNNKGKEVINQIKAKLFSMEFYEKGVKK